MIFAIFIVGIVVYCICTAVEESNSRIKDQQKEEAERFTRDLLRRYRQKNEYNK